MEMNNQKRYRLDWNTVRHDWPLWVLMAGVLLASFVIYPYLPDQVPGHWNIHGQVDAYYPRSFGAFFPPLLAIAIYLLMLFTPVLNPRRDNYVRFKSAYTFLRWITIIFLVLIYAAAILAALGYQINIGIVVKALVAVLFIMIGNYMGQFRHNYFVGIKTPWTLANEEVWQRTHRIAGRIWVLGGFVCLATAPFQADWSAYVFFAALMLMTFVPVVYSYMIFNKLQNR